MLTPYIICCTVKVTIFKNILSRIYGTICGPLKIPGGSPVVYLEHVENHSFGMLQVISRCHLYFPCTIGHLATFIMNATLVANQWKHYSDLAVPYIYP